MSPIDDELRNLFHSRADVLSPAPDPLHGIEQRARRMRRNRIAASVAGTALAVSAIAVAVPAVLPDRGGDGGTQYASPRPSASAQPSPSTALGAAALDPQNPWAYRGDPKLLGNGNLATIEREWLIRHPGTTLKPLYGYVYEPSATAEIVFVSTSQGSDRWGIAKATESGPEFVHDQALPYGATVLMAALPGDEVARLLVLAAPSTGDIGYAADGTTFQSVPMPEAGVGFHSLEGDTSKDAVRILDGDGNLDDPVFQGPAPDFGAASGDGGPVRTTPANLLDWPTRGQTPEPGIVAQAVADFARQVGASAADVEHKLLFGGTDSYGRVILLMQAWLHGNDARTFGWVVGKGPGIGLLGKVTDEGPAIQAFVAPADGEATQTLVVVGEPNAAQVRYAGSATAAFSTVEGGGAVLIDRATTAQGDRIELITSNGTMIFRSSVRSTVCTTMTDC